MRKLLCLSFALLALASCGEFSKVQKCWDYEYKYDVAKALYAEGHYGQSSLLLGDVLASMKGTAYGEECLYLLAMSTFNVRDYESSASYFRKYYQSYPKGKYVEEARYKCGYSLYKQTPDPRLDQTSTQDALLEFTNFIELYPNTKLKDQTQEMIYALQDKLIEKEYLAAKLYFNLGDYMNNCAYGGSNYEACVITSENAIKDYPFASPERREEFAILILRSKYLLARKSVEEKRVERFRNAIDECYAFENDFPESKYLKEAKQLLQSAENIVKRKKLDLSEEE